MSPVGFRRFFPERSPWEFYRSGTGGAVARYKIEDRYGFQLGLLERIHIHCDFGGMTLFPFVREDLGSFSLSLFFPADNLVAVDTKLGGDFVDRHFSPKGSQGDLGLEVWTELCSSGAHCYSLLFLGSPLNVTNLKSLVHFLGSITGEYLHLLCPERSKSTSRSSVPGGSKENGTREPLERPSSLASSSRTERSIPKLVPTVPGTPCRRSSGERLA